MLIVEVRHTYEAFCGVFNTNDHQKAAEAALASLIAIGKASPRGGVFRTEHPYIPELWGMLYRTESHGGVVGMMEDPNQYCVYIEPYSLGEMFQLVTSGADDEDDDDDDW